MKIIKVLEKRNPIILIHGLWNTSRIFSSITSKLDDIGIEYFAPTLEHSYGITSIIDLTNTLNEFILDIFLWTDFEKCTVDDDIEKTIDYSKLVQILKDQSKKIYCFTIEKYSNAILELIDQEFKLSKIKIILTKCNPPITGFDGKVSIVRILENN